jgi:TonB family protein
MRSSIAVFVLVLLLNGCSTLEHPTVLAQGASIGVNDRLPQARHLVLPEYSLDLKRAGVQGVVMLEVIVAKDGSVFSAKAIDSPDPRLSALAEAAALKSTFEPGLRNGVPTACRLRVPITFKIE